MTAHNAMQPDPASLYMNKDEAGRRATLCLGAGALGLLATFLGMLMEGSREQALFSYLGAYLFVITLATGGLFFVLLQHVTAARWSVTVRRIAEMMASTLPWLALLFVPLAAAVAQHQVWPWTSHTTHEPAVAAKAGYLNVPFFLIRAVFYLGLWALLGRIVYRRSVELDRTGDPYILLGLRKLSAPAMLLWALSLTFAGFDWAMSLDPAWYSTIFGVYVFAGTAVSSLSVITLWGLYLHREGYLRRVVTTEHYHDLGKLIFGFVVFWTYIAFSQYFLYWYGNIPEETRWFARRWAGGWPAVSVLLAVGHFAVPFFGLLSRGAKRSRSALLVFGSLLVLIHWLDMHWLVMPELHRHGPALSWLDATALLGLGGIFLGIIFRRMASAPLIPVKDPYLQESLEFVNNA
jgi:hypothetical protein